MWCMEHTGPEYLSAESETGLEDNVQVIDDGLGKRKFGVIRATRPNALNVHHLVATWCPMKLIISLVLDYKASI